MDGADNIVILLVFFVIGSLIGIVIQTICRVSFQQRKDQDRVKYYQQAIERMHQKRAKELPPVLPPEEQFRPRGNFR